MDFVFESYSLEQWILLFFIYSFFGYIWEVCYVSLRQYHWTDRGFLYGPILPIYGAGALIVLFATIPVKSSGVLVFICGMLAATLLEYVTGWAMEKLFNVRYWDYSNDFLNINGYVCLRASLAWGVFSLVLINFLHAFIEQLLFMIPDIVLSPCAFILTAAFSVDVTVSVRAALDLKEVLKSITTNNEELRRLQKRLDVVAAFIEEDKAAFKEKLEGELENLNEKMEDFKEEQAFIRSQRKSIRQQHLEQAREDRRKRLEQLQASLKSLESYLAQSTDDLSAERQTARENNRLELSDIRTRLNELSFQRRLAREQRSYRHAQNVLKRNYSAMSRRYAEALEELREPREKKQKGKHRGNDHDEEKNPSFG